MRTDVLTASRRQGTHTSASLAIPPSGVSTIRVSAPVNAGDRTSGTARLRAVLERSDDGGRSWRHWRGFHWFAPTDTNPQIEFDVADLAGAIVRVVLDVPQSLRCGASIEII